MKFDGAYLESKLEGKLVIDCVKAVQVCTANVIMNKGAIIDKTVQFKDYSL